MTLERIVVVSNRLPIILGREGSQWTVRPASGGLVQALNPVLKDRGGLWIGWPGVVSEQGEGWRDRAGDAAAEAGYELDPVALSSDEITGFYRGFANSVLWPLFHDLVDTCDFDPSFWHVYLEVNEKYGATVARHTGPEDLVWIHDYQLIHVGRFVRQHARQPRKLGFFLHIPFPPLDVFLKLPWRADLLRAFLDYDLVGLQTARDRRNFVTCLRHLLPDVKVSRVRGSVVRLEIGQRSMMVGNFPIGIDARGFGETARTPEVVAKMEELRNDLRGRRLVLGVDRLDYTKGTAQRILAFEHALEKFPEHRKEVAFIQITVPSREDVPEYGELRDEIERLVGRINGRFATPGWTPVQYHYRSVSRTTLVAFYRLAEAALVTPVKDGMNLVAKEYCACQVDSNGALILSEFAGAAAQLRTGALLVNPYDVEGMAAALDRALRLDEEQRRRRMRKMRSNVRRQDVFWWVRRYMTAFAGHPVERFVGAREYLPEIDLHEP